jgi:hypothetical protein
MAEPMNDEGVLTVDGLRVHCAHDRLVDVVELVPNPRNPNKHGEEQTKVLARIIKHQGWRAPIVVSKLSGYIVAGHGRLQAAKLLGLTQVPVNYQHFNTSADEDAHLLADNRIAELADLDLEEVAAILSDIKDDIDPSLTGFDDKEVEALLEGNFEVVDPDYEPKDKHADEYSKDEKGSLISLLNVVIADPKHEVGQGDLWMLGRHYLTCSSVFKDYAVWMPLIEEAGPDALFVPYPSPMTAVGNNTKDKTLVMVVPDPYVAGHILDRYVEVNGEGSVTKVR